MAEKKKLAIVGTGIAGMGCAHYLQHQYALTVFEKNDYAGGHTNTLYIPENEKNIPVDTGFIVFNEINYPHLIRLFKELNVPVKKTSMSFSAQVKHHHLEYCGSSLNLLFAQRKNLFSPRYIKFLMQLNKFNSECLEVLEDERLQKLSIAEYCNYKKFGNDLLDWYLLPMSSALWSTAPETTSLFPAVTLVRFFKNHGFLGLNTQFQWYTVDGGSEEYKKRLINPFKERIQLNNPVSTIKRKGELIEVVSHDGNVQLFDKLIVATHADQAMQMLDEGFEKEKEMLSTFRYEKNKATLHTDETVMPSKRRAWSSWNYCIGKKGDALQSACTYWMNSLQNVSPVQNYFVTINECGPIKQEKIIREIIYEHPIFTVKAMEMQKKLPELNSNGQLYFCGSYFRYGFHEDALMSAIAVCDKLLKS